MGAGGCFAAWGSGKRLAHNQSGGSHSLLELNLGAGTVEAETGWGKREKLQEVSEASRN